MQLTIGTYQLVDGTDPNTSVSNFEEVSEVQVQESLALGASSASLFPRGNKKITLTFAIYRVQTDAETAAFFCVDHEIQFPIQGRFTYSTTAGERYLENAVIVVTKATFTGATTMHTYRVEGGAFYETGAGGAPAPF